MLGKFIARMPISHLSRNSNAEECRDVLRTWKDWPSVVPAGHVPKSGGTKQLPKEVSILPFYAEADDPEESIADLIPDPVSRNKYDNDLNLLEAH